jgi:hypothetical protein
MALSGGEIVILIIITIIGIVVVGWLFWYFLLRHNGNDTGEHCTVNSDCSPGHYCGGGNQCVLGLCGGSLGTVCDKNADCNVGLLCVSERCIMSTGPLLTVTPMSSTTTTTTSTLSSSSILTSGLSSTRTTPAGFVDTTPTSTDENPISSFNRRLIMVSTVEHGQNKYYYLNTTSNRSDWVHTARYSYSYDSANRTLTATNLSTGRTTPVGISTDGQLILTTSANQARITIVDVGDSGGVVMRDRYGNELSVGELQYFPQAVFKDSSIGRTQYPDQNPQLQAVPVLFEIVRSLLDGSNDNGAIDPSLDLCFIN